MNEEDPERDPLQLSERLTPVFPCYCTVKESSVDLGQKTQDSLAAKVLAVHGSRDCSFGAWNWKFQYIYL